MIWILVVLFENGQITQTNFKTWKACNEIRERVYLALNVSQTSCVEDKK